MLFVGAREINDEMLKDWGLKVEKREDPGRGREATFYVNENGESLAKKIYPGFVVVLSRSFELAEAVARKINNPSEEVELSDEVLGHKVYTPTSVEKAKGEEDGDMSFLDRKEEKAVNQESSDSQELERLEDRFYSEMAYIKSHVIYLDALKALKRKKAKKDEQVSEQESRELSNKISEKIDQKMDELKCMIKIMSSELAKMPKKIGEVTDMAGGAGDLGLAVGMELMVNGHDVKKIRIVDPVKELAGFTKSIIGYLPFREKYENIVENDQSALQETEINPDSIVVAKHACGDLTDGIIEKWKGSESPMLIMMTCCQDKAANQPARYDISQADWEKWCKTSSKTNTQVPQETGSKRDKALRKLQAGQDAMDNLDKARVDYLNRQKTERGESKFEAKLEKAENYGYNFPKGNVIIVKRKDV